jgi:cytoskeletal protein CcmA (bactofilin family)
LKDGGSKSISERATRFLPVDMKDRLKSAFNRNSANTGASTPPAEDAPDYTTIFNPSRSEPVQNNPRFTGPLMSGPLSSDALNPISLKTASRHVVQDIEEAEIVVVQPGEGSKVSEARDQIADFGVVLKLARSKAVTGERTRPQIEASHDAQAASTKDFKLQPEIEASSDSSKRGEAVSQKSRSSFFGDFSSTESVRLKVEKRIEKRTDELPVASGVVQHAKFASAEVTVLGAERGAVPVFALDNDPPKPPTNGHHATAEGVAAESVGSEHAHISLLEEYDSMEAKEHESENGAAVQSDPGTSAAAIVIERNSKFSGQLKFGGTITIEGQVDGGLIADRIVVNEGGLVVASIDGNTIVIGGTVTGDIIAHNELEILASGVVDGSVTAPAITVRRGARVEGRCTIGVPRE